jgi:hypothetical protein
MILILAENWKHVIGNFSDKLRHNRHPFEGKILAGNRLMATSPTTTSPPLRFYSSTDPSFQQNTPSVHHPPIFTGLDHLFPFLTLSHWVTLFSFAFAAPRSRVAAGMAQTAIAADNSRLSADAVSIRRCCSLLPPFNVGNDCLSGGTSHTSRHSIRRQNITSDRPYLHLEPNALCQTLSFRR